jgi:hypothetical protein
MKLLSDVAISVCPKLPHSSSVLSPLNYPAFFAVIIVLAIIEVREPLSHHTTF